MPIRNVEILAHVDAMSPTFPQSLDHVCDSGWSSIYSCTTEVGGKFVLRPLLGLRRARSTLPFLGEPLVEGETIVMLLPPSNSCVPFTP